MQREASNLATFSSYDPYPTADPLGTTSASFWVLEGNPIVLVLQQNEVTPFPLGGVAGCVGTGEAMHRTTTIS